MININETSTITLRRKAILSAMAALLTGIGYALLFRGQSRLWDVFWLAIVAVAVGGHVGAWLEDRQSRGRKSVGLSVLLVNLGVATMAAIWWFSTLEATSLIGSLCRGLAGAYTGAAAVVILTMEPYGKPVPPGEGSTDA
jgi:hypothetical protein